MLHFWQYCTEMSTFFISPSATRYDSLVLCNHWDKFSLQFGQCSKLCLDNSKFMSLVLHSLSTNSLFTFKKLTKSSVAFGRCWMSRSLTKGRLWYKVDFRKLSLGWVVHQMITHAGTCCAASFPNVKLPAVWDHRIVILPANMGYYELVKEILTCCVVKHGAGGKSRKISKTKKACEKQGRAV